MAHRQGISILMTLLALACLGGSAYGFQHNNSLDISPLAFRSTATIQANADANINDNLALFRVVRATIPLAQAALLWALGSGLWLAALTLSRPLAWMAWPARLPSTWQHFQPNGFLLMAGIIALGLLAESNAQLFTSLGPLHYHVQYLLWSGGLLALVLGLVGWQPAANTQGDFLPKREWAFIALVTALALLLRLWHLGNIRVLVDELPFLTSAVSLERQPQTRLLAPINNVFAFPWVYSYWVQASLEVFGRTYAAGRIPSALLGTAAIPALYLLARHALDRPTATIAAILLATFPPHLHFSRLNLLHGGDALAGLCAFGLWWRAWQRNQPGDFILGGLALGLTQYFYEGGRLALPAIWACWVGLGFILWPKAMPWRGLLLGTFTALVTAAPVYYTLYGLEASGGQRFQTVRLPAQHWQALAQASPDDLIFQGQLDRTLSPFLHYVSVPDLSIFYAGETPLLLLPLLPFFLAGLATLLSHWRDPLAQLLWLWLVLPPLGQSLLVESGISVRLVLTLPALMLVTAIGIRTSLGLLGGRMVWMIALALFLGFYQSTYYFTDHLEAFNQRFRLVKPYPDGEDALLRASEDGRYFAGTRLVIISDPLYPEGYAREILFFLNETYQVETRHPASLDEAYLKSLQDGFDHLFFVQRHDVATVRLLTRYFDLGPAQFSPYAEDIPDERELVLYVAPAYQTPPE